MATKQIGVQEPFLANTTNKKGFIVLLKQYLEQQGITVCQAADRLIVSTALKNAVERSHNVVVVAEDTDILVMLLRHYQSTMQNVFFTSEAKKDRGGRQIAAKCINIAAAQHQLEPSVCQCLPAVHAFGGFDTTSAIFGHGKRSIYAHLNSSAQLQHHCITLQTEAATHDEVTTAGLTDDSHFWWQ